MRKFLSLLAVLVLASVLAYAQVKSITGRILDEKGSPIPFSSILIKGTKTGTSADAEGNFMIRAKEGDVLVVSTQGRETKEATVGSDNFLAITLKASSTILEEVVVTTAFGIKKEQRTTPYSTQVIKGEALNIIPQTNLNDALAGKVAGVQFRSQSGTKLNSQTFARIRGGLLLTGDVGPIFVVNGTIVGDAYDIDPNTIESINFLKGANATGLFGARASNGAIVITTKKAAQGKTSIEVNQGITVDKVYRLPKLQNVYAGGGSSDLINFKWEEGMPEEWKALDGKAYNDYTDDASWGPKMEGQEYIPWYAWVPGNAGSFKTARLTPQPDNIKDFWETGMNSNTNVTLYSGGKGYNTRISYSKQYIKGLLPNSKTDRNIFSSSTSFDINKFISAGIDFTYNTQKIVGEFDDGYANNSSGNFGQWNHRHLDMKLMKSLKDLKTPIGTYASWNWASNPAAFNAADPAGFYTGNYWYNFYSYMDAQSLTQRRDRFFGNVYLNLRLNENFNIRGTVRRDQYNYWYENIAPSILEASGSQTGYIAGYSTGERNQAETNYELIASYNDRFFGNDLTVSALAGGNIFTYQRKDVDAATVNGLIIYDMYSLSNSKANPSLSNSRLGQRINSFFAGGDFEYKKFISATWALRQDWSSTLPATDNSLFYPSLGLAFVASEFTGDVLPWVSFAKVYGSWGKKPLSLGIYDLNFTYPINQNKWDGNVLQNVANTIPDNNLSGALITSYEAGIELRFLNNRVGINATYYNETAADQPLTIQLPGQSGFTGKTVNAATVKRQGFEFVVNGTPISTKDFAWSFTKTLGYLTKNPVTKLIEGTNRIQPSDWIGSFGTRYASSFQVAGKDWGQLIGGGLQRNEAGIPLVDPNTGLYVAGNPNHEWGSIVPKVTGGFQNTFTYKNFILNASIDYQFGGKFFSLTESWGMFSGLLDYTAATNDRGMNVRDALANGGGVRVTGVSSVDGKSTVDMYVDGFTYFHQFYNSQIADPFVHKLSFVKLREVSLGYNLPLQKWNFLNNAIKGITVAVIARNPWLIYSATKNFDPSEISNVYGENGQLPSVRSLGFNVKFNF